MATTIAGTFEDRAAAQRAVEGLRAAGVPASDISMIVRGEETAASSEHQDIGVRGGAATTVSPTRPNVEPGLAQRAVDDEVEPITAEDYSATEAGAATGGLIGAVSGFLVGLGTIALPGLGPIVAAGPLAAALGGTAIGAATGGLIGALVDAGVPEEYASTYATHVQRGHVLLTARADAVSPKQVREIMAHSGALNVYPGATTLV
jgi:uncharacterized membrane protein